MSVLKEKHNRLSDNLIQRLSLLDEANRKLIFIQKKVLF
jgi:hypothetical protein